MSSWFESKLTPNVLKPYVSTTLVKQINCVYLMYNNIGSNSIIIIDNNNIVINNIVIYRHILNSPHSLSVSSPCINHFKPEFTIVIFIHYKPRIAVAILYL